MEQELTKLLSILTIIFVFLIITPTIMLITHVIHCWRDGRKYQELCKHQEKIIKDNDEHIEEMINTGFAMKYELDKVKKEYSALYYSISPMKNENKKLKRELLQSRKQLRRAKRVSW